MTTQLIVSAILNAAQLRRPLHLTEKETGKYLEATVETFIAEGQHAKALRHDPVTLARVKALSKAYNKAEAAAVEIAKTTGCIENLMELSEEEQQLLEDYWSTRTCRTQKLVARLEALLRVLYSNNKACSEFKPKLEPLEFFAAIPDEHGNK
jgi:hypothetical protein